MRAIDDRYVSTGHLPEPWQVQETIEQAHRELAANDGGRLSTTYPVLSTADPDRFGICVVGVAGRCFEVGDTDHRFPIMSVAKPFVFALAAQRLGLDEVVAAVGVGATGQAFNAIAPIESTPAGRTNPMVNSGAIATASLLGAACGEDAWSVARDGLSDFAGRQLQLDEQVYSSASGSNSRNRGIAHVLHDRQALATDPGSAVDLYTRLSCLQVTARDLAVMGATLADAGTNPITGTAVVADAIAAATLAVMVTSGMYEDSGQWLLDVGLPAKSGIGGGIVTAAPGKGGMGTYSPLLDAAGNSVRGTAAARRLSTQLGLHLFAAKPEPSAATGQPPGATS
jgi:glutaminase